MHKSLIIFLFIKVSFNVEGNDVLFGPPKGGIREIIASDCSCPDWHDTVFALEAIWHVS